LRGEGSQHKVELTLKEVEGKKDWKMKDKEKEQGIGPLGIEGVNSPHYKRETWTRKKR